MIRPLATILLLCAAAPIGAQSLYGNQVPTVTYPATSLPVPTLVLPRPSATPRPRAVRPAPRSIVHGFVPQPGYYVYGGGGVTVWAGTPPPWLRRGPAYRPAPPPNPCAAGFGGAASADAAIGAATSVDGRRC